MHVKLVFLIYINMCALILNIFFYIFLWMKACKQKYEFKAWQSHTYYNVIYNAAFGGFKSLCEWIQVLKPDKKKLKFIILNFKLQIWQLADSRFSKMA